MAQISLPSNFNGWAHHIYQTTRTPLLDTDKQGFHTENRPRIKPNLVNIYFLGLGILLQTKSSKIILQDIETFSGASPRISRACTNNEASRAYPPIRLGRQHYKRKSFFSLYSRQKMKINTLIIIITEICIAPFPKVSQIKGASKKVEKAVYRKSKQFAQKAQQKLIYRYSECFVFSFYLPKQYQRAVNPHPIETKNEERKKATEKHHEENQQGSIDGVNKFKID